MRSLMLLLSLGLAVTPALAQTEPTPVAPAATAVVAPVKQERRKVCKGVEVTGSLSPKMMRCKMVLVETAVTPAAPKPAGGESVAQH